MLYTCIYVYVYTPYINLIVVLDIQRRHGSVFSSFQTIHYVSMNIILDLSTTTQLDDVSIKTASTCTLW